MTTQQPNLPEDDPIIAKSVAMCSLFVASLILGTIPLFLSRWFRLSLDGGPHVRRLLCAGGGVLLCTTFIHLLPEVSDKIADIDVISVKDIDYAEVLMCAGFFGMYLVEETTHSFLSHKAPKMRHEKDAVMVCEEADRSHLDHSHAPGDGGHSHFDPENSLKTIRGLFVVLALSVHELFEGLAVGLESSSRSVWYMFGAVAAHKLVIAFCVGVELVASGMKRGLVVMYVFIFAVVSPMGIGVGILVAGGGQERMAVPSVFLQGLASGTLLYVVFFEILSAERKAGLVNFFCVLGGFLLMFAVKYFGE